MPTTYTPPAESYGWPTRTRLLDRLAIPRGLSVITDGAGGWYTDAFPPLTTLQNLTEGTDYFVGGHEYFIDCTTAQSLYNHGLFPDYPSSACVVGHPTYPSFITWPSAAIYPEG